MSISDAETLVAHDFPNAKPKKRPRNRNMQPKPVEEKLAEMLGRELAIELAKIGPRYLSTDFLDKLALAPRQSCDNHTTTSVASTSVSTTSTAVEVVRCTSKESIRSGNQPIKAKYKIGGNIFTLDDLSASKLVENKPIDDKYKTSGSIFTLADFTAITALETLVDQYGKVSHMGILDRSYSFFVTEKRDAALYFKVKDKVAVVGGDPLCDKVSIDRLLMEFAKYRKQFNWDIAFLGATSEFAIYAQSKRWVTMKFGVERVLNPMTNPLLLETGCGKRTISQSKALLRNGITLGIYSPKHKFNPVLQAQLVDIYDSWCSHRNGNAILQAYLTVYDPFAIPELMTYVYTKDASGDPCGFAALRKIVNGYHIDPCIAIPGSPRGISELLIISTMSLLREAGVSYLSLGFEPSTELGEISGLAKAAQSLTRAIHRHTYRDLPIGGKRGFHDKFRPDEEQEADLYLVFPGRLPKLRHMKAMMHIVNIDISKLLAEDVKRAVSWTTAKRKNQTEEERKQEVKQVGKDQHLGAQSLGLSLLPERWRIRIKV